MEPNVSTPAKKPPGIDDTTPVMSQRDVDAAIADTQACYAKFLQSVAFDISEHGWDKSQAPDPIKYWLAMDVMTTLSEDVVRKIFKMYVDKKKDDGSHNRDG